MSLRNLRLGTKLMGSFLVIALIGGVIGVIGIVKIRTIDRLDLELYQVNTEPLGHIGNIAVAFQRVRVNLRDALMDRFLEKKDISSYMETIQGLDKKIDADLKEFEASIKSQEVRQEFEALRAGLSKYGPVQEKIFALAKEEKREEAMSLMHGDAHALAKAVDEGIHKLFQTKIDQAKKKADENAATAKGAVFATLIITIFGVALAAVCGVLITRSITRPIQRIIAGLTDGAEQVASASSQVSSSSQSLAEGASEQAAGLEETSSSIEEMATMTKQNSENAHEAKTKMEEARQIVENVNRHMGEMGGAVAQITKSSEETGKIIKTIDEIAFQTNLLALNAAVEAARAGEVGAGFAVVADEVRNLAMRASEAAKNTNALIENTIKAVKSGNELTISTQAAFQKNVEIAGKIGKLVDGIAAASQEQAQGIGQVNKAVAEMDKVTQQNAANAEESASAAEEMNAQAEQMRAFVAELAAVIGGTSHGNGRNLLSEVKGRLPLKKGAPSSGNGASQAGGPKRDGKGKGLNPIQNKAMRPEQLIPLGDGDFKEF